MSNAIRVIKKSLVTMQDLVKGYGKVIQQRQGEMYELDKINTIWLKETITEVKEADYLEMPIISVFVINELVAYVYDSESTAEPDDDTILMPSSETGRWIKYSMTVAGSAGSLNFGTAQNQLPRNSDLNRSISINAGGSETVVLTDEQAQAKYITFTGTATQNIDIVVPNRFKVWYMVDATEGSFTRSIRTANSAPLALPKNSIVQIRCDGADLISKEPTLLATEEQNILGESSSLLTTPLGVKQHVDSRVLEGIRTASVRRWFTQNAASDGWLCGEWSPELRLFVIAGFGAGISISKNGTGWTTHVIPENNSWNSIAWSPELGLFVAVASSGTNRVMTSPNGINWTARSAAAANTWTSVVWSSALGLFVAVSSDGTNRVMTSPDGITWTSRSSQTSFWTDIAWSSELGLFVAVSSTAGSAQLMTSSNGIDWTGYSAASDDSWNSVTWSPELGLFVAVSSTGTSPVMASADGQNWTLHTSAESNNWVSVTWSPELGLFAAVSADGANRIMSSEDGINWLPHTAATAEAWRTIVYSPELKLFMCAASGFNNNTVMTSL